MMIMMSNSGGDGSGAMEEEEATEGCLSSGDSSLLSSGIIAGGYDQVMAMNMDQRPRLPQTSGLAPGQGLAQGQGRDLSGLGKDVSSLSNESSMYSPTPTSATASMHGLGKSPPLVKSVDIYPGITH